MGLFVSSQRIFVLDEDKIHKNKIGVYSFEFNQLRKILHSVCTNNKQQSQQRKEENTIAPEKSRGSCVGRMKGMSVNKKPAVHITHNAALTSSSTSSFPENKPDIKYSQDLRENLISKEHVLIRF